MSGYHWVPTSTYSVVPPSAVVGGADSDGSDIYVGRAFHNGDWVPAKIVPSRQQAYISYGGQEIELSHYEILCEQRFEWLPASNGSVPPNSVVGGRTAEGEPLYIGRTFHEGSNTIGKVHPSHGCLYIPYGGMEHRYEHYEILVMI